MIGSGLVSPNILLAYVARHDGPAAAGRTSADAWVQYLVDQIGGSPTNSSRKDLEYAWLVGLGATGKTLSDLYASFLGAKGAPYAGKQLDEQMHLFFQIG